MRVGILASSIWVAPSVALVLVAQTGTSLAQEDASRDAEARSLFNAGQTALGDGRFEDALVHFKHAYELSGRPEMLYNIGVAADRLRRDREALDAFEQFLAEVPPDAPKRRNAAARIEILRQKLAAAEASDDGAPSAESGVQSGEGSGRTPGWIVLGTGAGALVSGAVVLGVGQAKASNVENAEEGTPWTSVAGDASRADRLRNVGWAMLGVGVVGAGLGLGLALAAGGDAADRAARLEVVPGGLRLRGTF